MNESDEENVHYISDQDSNDEKPQIESIIKEKSKLFKNESYAIKILLSDHHRDLRSTFFTNIRRIHNSVYQAIKREIRNCLNPYRRHIDKDTNIPKEAQELYESLKQYYKDKNFNNTFFINYFKDLEDLNKNKSKSKFINLIPKDEKETLNDLQRKVTIIKNLKHYLNTNIRDRIQINFDQKKGMFNEDDFTMMYKYLVITEKKFSEISEDELDKYISNKKDSYKFRRPLNDFNAFNYLPILCKGYCQKEAKLFCNVFERVIQKHGLNCKKCKELYENLDIIKSQIRSLYNKTCIFSHNINEIMFHPLVFYSFSNSPFYKKQLGNNKINNINNIIYVNEPSQKYKNMKNMDIRMIYNPADNGMKEIFNKLKSYSSKIGLFGNNCYLPENKTNKCSIDLFKPNTENFSTHIMLCPFYHSELEKRRNFKIKENEICKEVIKDGKWKTDEENINCKNSDSCTKFHTRNEVFFDERNYRKLYPCNDKQYCKKGKLCPKKHAIDMKIDEIYLPLDSKKELERELKKLIEKNKKIQNKLQNLSKIQCKSCLNFIDGEKGTNLYIFRKCNHAICSKCFEFYNSCPLCGLSNEEDEIIYIELDYENKNKNENKKENKNEDDKEDENEDDNLENNEKYEDEEKFIEDNNEENSKDDEIKDLEESDYNNDTQKEEDILLKACNEVKYNSEDNNEDNEDITMATKNEKQKNKRIGINYNDKNNENSYNDSSYSSNYNNSRDMNRSGKGKIRGRGQNRGHYNNRGNFNNYNNNYSREIRKGYKRGSKRGSNYENNQSNNSDFNNNTQLDEYQKKESYENSMVVEFQKRERGKKRGRGVQRGRGIIRGRGTIRGRYNDRNDCMEEESNSSNEDNYVKNKSKKVSFKESNEESD